MATFQARSTIRGQSVLEYALLLGVAIVVLVMMQVFVKRAYQGRLKNEADSLGPQFSVNHSSTMSGFNLIVESSSYTGGRLVNDGVVPAAMAGTPVTDGMSVTVTRSTSNVTRQERTGSLVLD